MSVKSSIERLKDRRVPFEKKSYHDLKIAYEVLNAKEFVKNPSSSDLKERIFKIEYSVDKVEEIIKLYCTEKDKVINVFELRDFFSDIGFNVDVAMSEIFRSDITMVYNIGGYVIPFWDKLVSSIFKKNKETRRMLISALSPGIKRFHCRLYHGSDGAWYITSHVDHSNWLNVLNPVGIFVSHAVRGTGDFSLGTKIMKIVLSQAIELHKQKKDLFIDVNKIYLESSKS
ncbi:MAG TPA: hypothetical protein PKH06_03005 [Candidatus Dojkabacteria bacterium]|nr:hypothetical protein [Candidatus Dojkabacteria bacterium]